MELLKKTNINKLLKSIEIVFSKIPEDFLRRAIIDYFTLKNYGFVTDININSTKEYNIRKTSNKMTKEEAFSIMEEFFSTLPSDIYEICKKEFTNLPNIIEFVPVSKNSEVLASTYNNNGSYTIKTPPIKTFDELNPLIHEYGHLISFHYKDMNEWSNDYSTFLAEFSSTFIHLLLLKHLLENEKYKIDSLDTMISLYNTMISNINLIKTRKRYAEESLDYAGDPDNNNEKFYQYLNSKYLLDLNDFNSLYTSDCTTYMPYIIGTMLSIELAKVYDEDPNRAFEIYKKILTLEENRTCDYLSKINEMGIVPGKHIEEFHQELVRKKTNFR